MHADTARSLGIVSRIIGLLVMLFAVPFLAVSGCTYHSARQLTEHGQVTTGRVVEMLERDGENGSAFAPVFTFADEAGASHKVYSSHGSYPPRYQVGDAVEVIYDPAAPRDGRINSFRELWLFPTIFGIVALVPMSFGLVLLLVVPLILRRSGRPQPAPSPDPASE